MMRIKLQPGGGTAGRAGVARVTEELRYRLFAEDKLAEFAAMGVPPEQASLLVKMQYRGRAMSYAEAYPQAEEMLLCLQDGAEEIAIGRLLLARATGSTGGSWILPCWPRTAGRDMAAARWSRSSGSARRLA